MTKEQFDREKKFQAAMSIARAMLMRGIISERDYTEILTRFTAKFCPVFAGLYALKELPFCHAKG